MDAWRSQFCRAGDDQANDKLFGIGFRTDVFGIVEGGPLNGDGAFAANENGGGINIVIHSGDDDADLFHGIVPVVVVGLLGFGSESLVETDGLIGGIDQGDGDRRFLVGGHLNAINLGVR